MSLDQQYVSHDGQEDLDGGKEPRDGSHLKDEVLLAFSQENPRFFEALVGRYQEPFLRAAMRVVHRHEDAEDIVQEAFLRIYRNAHRFVKQENIEFKSWAYKIVLNTSFTHYQRLKKQGLNQEADGDEMLTTVISDKDNLGATVEAKLLIENALFELPADLGRVLRKHYLEDKAYETIAREDATTVAAIKMKLYRARKALKKLFLSDGGSTRKTDRIAVL